MGIMTGFKKVIKFSLIFSLLVSCSSNHNDNLIIQEQQDQLIIEPKVIKSTIKPQWPYEPITPLPENY